MNLFNFITPTFYKTAFEITCLLLFFICLFHSGITHGWKRTIREFTAGFFLTACCESVGVLSGAYVYPGFNFYLFQIPIANPASWIALIYIVMEISNKLVFKTEVSSSKLIRNKSFIFTITVLALIDSSFALVVDLVMDPLATVYNWWLWVEPHNTKVLSGDVDLYNFDKATHLFTPDNPIYNFFSEYFVNSSRYPTRLFGIPIINFISWFIFVFVFAFQFRYVEFHNSWSELKKTLVLWILMIIDVPILCFILIVPNL